LENLNRVSIRLISETPLLSEEFLTTPQKANEVVGDYIRDMDRETLCVVNYNSKLQPINFSVVSIGAVNQTVAVPREILKTAILSNATSIGILHNHPSGDLTPSKQDIMLTDRLIRACDLMGINLVDHIIVGPKTHNYYSLREKRTCDFCNYPKYTENIEFLNFKNTSGNRVAEREVNIR